MFSGVDGAELGRFLAFDAKQRGGVRVAVGDVERRRPRRDPRGAGQGREGRHALRAFDGRTFEDVTSFHAFDTEYKRGVFVSGVRR